MNLKILSAVFFILGCLAFSAIAKKLYKFQDEDGVWHYTDQKPSTQQKVEIRQLKVEPRRRVWLLKTGREKQPEFFVRNDYFGPVEVELEFDQYINVASVPALPGRFIVQPGQSDSLLQMGAVNRYRPWSFTLKYRYTIGNPSAKHDRSYLYLPPFAVGSRFRISQAFDGRFSHQDPQNKYAVDISMPVGTPLIASRDGVVMEVEDDYFKGGTDHKAYRSRANSIRILHDDGSMAVYAHLQLEKAQVYPGLYVEAGQLIGHSGNTGYSSGPHLHFAIQVNKGMALESVPFKFLNSNGGFVRPEKGIWLSGGAYFSKRES